MKKLDRVRSLLLLLLLPLLLVLRASPAAAQLSVDPRTIDFGDRGHNESLSQPLRITNTGKVSLTIGEVKPSCGCIRADPPSPSSTIPPGASVEVLVTMSSGRAMGTLEKYLEITTKETGVRGLRVPIRMRVFEGLNLEPRDLRFDGVVGGTPVTQAIEIKQSRVVKDPKPLQVTEPVVVGAAPGSGRTPSPHFKTKVTDVAGGKKLEVTLLGTHPEGRISANLEAKVDGKLFVVPVVGEMFRHIKVVPTYFNFSKVSSDDPGSYVKESVLTSTDGRAFKIVSLTPAFSQRPSDSCSIELEEKNAKVGGSATEHVLRARISAGEKPGQGSFAGKVVVKTDHPDKPELTLTFFGFFAEPRK